MLKIGQDPLNALTAASRSAEEARIVALLREHFLGTNVWTSEPEVTTLVRLAESRADALALRSAREVFKISALMLIFGPDFATRQTWARDLLAARPPDAPVADDLYDAGVAHVRAGESS